ncbi:MAG: DUF4234 domain-containing protein [Candidatus Pacearchaeota archaeon]
MKKRGIFAFLILIIVLSGCAILFFYQSLIGIDNFKFKSIPMTGSAISDVNVRFVNINVTVLIFIIQGIILGVIIFAIIGRTIKNRKQKSAPIHVDINVKKSKAQTDLDIFYNLLKQKKRIGVDVIAESFNISEEKALEWAKMLENEEIVSIDYPFLSSPEVVFIEKNNSEKNITPLADKIINSVEKNYGIIPNKAVKGEIKEKTANVKLVLPKIQSSKIDFGIKIRNPALVLLFTILTIGIYGFYWLFSTTKELGRYSKSAPKIWMVILLFFGFYLMILFYIIVTYYFSINIFSLPIDFNSFQNKNLAISSLIINVIIFAGIVIIGFIFFLKYSKAINEVTGFNNKALFILWIVFFPVALVISQMQLNKKSGNETGKVIKQFNIEETKNKYTAPAINEVKNTTKIEQNSGKGVSTISDERDEKVKHDFFDMDKNEKERILKFGRR